jgi:predicted PurR-regulated permease PerM
MPTSAKALSNFMVRGSDLHPSVCQMCGEVCLARADDCDRLGDDDMMRRCAEECRRCVLVGCGALILGLIAMQVAQVTQDWPAIQQSLMDLLQRGQAMLAQPFNMSPDAITTRARQLLEGLAGSAAVFFGSFVSALAMILLTLVYVVLMLAERDRFFRFVERLAPKGHAPNARAAMEESADAAYRYLIGRLKVMGIMGAILTTAFLLSGVPYAIFLAIVIVVSAIVPYLGILIGGLLTLLLTVVSAEFTTVLVVLAVLVLAQALENYVLEPLVVGQDVDLSPFMTVFAIVALGTVWGVAGAILALPLAAMAKVICAHVPGAAPVVSLMQADD